MDTHSGRRGVSEASGLLDTVSVVLVGLVVGGVVLRLGLKTTKSLVSSTLMQGGRSILIKHTISEGYKVQIEQVRKTRRRKRSAM
jgi:hypothetical protein